MDNQKDFKTLLDEALDLRGINYEKLAQLTNIPKYYILALQNSDINKLPAAPYVRGYLKKIAEILHLNSDDLWKIYEKELAHKKSGAFDKLPTNRFITPRHRKKTIIITAVVLVLLYILLNYKNLFGWPILEINEPRDSFTAVSYSEFNLKGKIDPKDKLMINGMETLVDSNGNFQSFYHLQPGLNTIEFKTKKLLGKEKSVIKQILYQLPVSGQ